MGMAHCQRLVAFFPFECFLQKALFSIGNDHSLIFYLKLPLLPPNNNLYVINRFQTDLSLETSLYDNRMTIIK